VVGSTVGDLGEKELIRTVVRPLLNPENIPDLPGDDCGVCWINPDLAILVSTDRVPWDLISFKMGLIDIWQLGYYTAILNISDVAAMGGRPLGLVMNLALPSSFLVADVEALLSGAARGCRDYECELLGGDFSSAEEPSIAAAVVGTSIGSRLLRRQGADLDHVPFCSDIVGLTPTAFAYFREARPKGFRLDEDSEQLLIRQFSAPKARVRLGQELARSDARLTCMDNTDGLGQSLAEIAQESGIGFILERELVPLHPVTYEVANFLDVDPLTLALAPGADFQLVGSFAGTRSPHQAIVRIGRSSADSGVISVANQSGEICKVDVRGWNYFRAESGEE
jgi:thiamine-monophosphate kinase